MVSSGILRDVEVPAFLSTLVVQPIASWVGGERVWQCQKAPTLFL